MNLERELAAFGARSARDGVEFRVWAPGHERVEVEVTAGNRGQGTRDRGQGTGDREEGAGKRREVPDRPVVFPLASERDGFFVGWIEGIGAGARYKYRLDGGECFPDPGSRSQPEGVHGASEVVDPSAFRWTDGGWTGIAPEELIIYELHVGTFTPQGTFDALVEKLPELKALGITALELMPISEFPGERNWGYDGVYLYAPSHAYGGPAGLRRLVDAAHREGLAVLLDVVYNHFGPEGNYLPLFTSDRIFTERHHTPWGAAVNYDGEDSRPVRDFVIGNVLYWLGEYHIDGLRLDATHAIIDDSPVHLLRELSVRVQESLSAERRVVLIAEDDRNERRLVLPVEGGGVGLDAVWADDFHHQLRRLVAGDSEGYYANYSGTVEDLATTLRKGWFYEGQLSPGHGGRRGTSAEGLGPLRFVHCIQNHDQVGNRAFGERLNHEVDSPVYRAASALLLFSPYIPLLWMGQEWAASSPFQYFTDHPPELGKLVTQGRRKEFSHFSAFADPETRARIPDPQSAETFQRSKLNWDERDVPPHAGVLRLYRELLAMRQSEPALRERSRASYRVAALGESGIALRRSVADGGVLLLVASFAGPLHVELNAREETRAPGEGRWELLLATEEARFGGGEGEVARLDPQGVLELGGAGAVVCRAGPARVKVSG